MTEVERARAELERIKAKYTRPDQQQYLTLLIAAWEYHIAVLEKEQCHLQLSTQRPASD